MNTRTANPSDNITLYYREGSSDKVYQCSIEPSGENLYAVTFAYGRRGSTLTTGCKTTSPVSYDEARAIFDRLVNEKLAKGYTPGADGTPYVGGNGDKQPSGYLPQLINPIDEDQVQRLLRDNVHVAQEKFDGRRMLLRKEGAVLHGINRKGLVIGMPEPIAQSLHLFPVDCLMDGESVGDVFHAFDLLNFDGQDIRARKYKNRQIALINLLASVQQRAIRFTETAYTAEHKIRMHATLQTAGKEGIVFKRLDAPYTPGRPNSGGPQLKHKFYATLSAVVSKINTQRSVEIRLFGKDGWSLAGNVTIPPNATIPVVGKVIEVRFLYATASGILYQPVYLGERSDIEQHECVRSQLKFKPTGEEAA